ncbi:RsmE family RNA methyltransferase [Marispirochaeta aestuarii]|uniref:RsmE family RNA methyltransferase n=1 Tax=Marispirochaeta aestuarii TaxID=1963862 RepID=UPI0029C994DA|nr:RsmE family RNA methyltransferase [Marispirochaeta aestuarii]
MRQFVLPPFWSGEEDLVLTGGEHHYLSRVLRLSPGIEFPALDSAGRRFDCRILSMDSESTSVKIRPQNKKVPEADFQLSLILGIPRGKKMDQVVRQATECGVRRIVPFLSDHSSVRLEPGDFRRKQERWKKVAKEALQQSGTGIPPEILLPIRHNDLKETTRDLDTVLFFHEKPLGDSGLHGLLQNTSGRIGLLIGPEGGFSHKELELFSSLHYDSIYLGDSVLRAETAAIYAVAAVQTILRESGRWQLKSPEHGA